MASTPEDEKDLKAVVLAELDDAKGFAKSLPLEQVRDGGWFLKLLLQVGKAYDRNARAAYFLKKYPGLPKDEIADTLISVATRYAAIVGAVTGTAATAGVIAGLPSGGASLAIMAGAIGAEMVGLAVLQMKLVLDMSVIYDLQLDSDDPEDMLMVFGYALGVAPAEAIGHGLGKAGVAFTSRRATLSAMQKFGQRLGLRVLQRTILKYAAPVASAGIGSVYNYVATKSLGEIAKRHLRNRGKVTDELREVISKRHLYDLTFPAAAMFMAQADGTMSAKEMELYRAMLTRMSFDEHAPEDFARLVTDKEGILQAVADIEDKDTASTLVELITLMAIYDGLLVPEEREFLECVSERLGVPLDMQGIEDRAKEYETILEKNVFAKTADAVGGAAVKTVGVVGHAGGRLRGVVVRACTRQQRVKPDTPPA
jgi:tellurite resistance protein